MLRILVGALCSIRLRTEKVAGSGLAENTTANPAFAEALPSALLDRRRQLVANRMTLLGSLLRIHFENPGGVGTGEKVDRPVEEHPRPVEIVA